MSTRPKKQDRVGAPSIYEEPLQDVRVGMPPRMIRYLRRRYGDRGISKRIRELIEAEMSARE